MIRDYRILNNIYGLRRICIRLLYITERKFVKISPMKLNLKNKASCPQLSKVQQCRIFSGNGITVCM